MNYKKNNSNNGKMQPYDSETGEYESYEFNFRAIRLGGDLKEFPLKFPHYVYSSSEYKSYYFNYIIDWRTAIIDKSKMSFLIKKNGKQDRDKIFRYSLGYNEKNSDMLYNEIANNIVNAKIFLTRRYDEFGFRVKAYIPVSSFDKTKKLIIKTIWIIKEGQKPKFVTAYFTNRYKEELQDEI